ncbi:AMP-binding protein [Polaribacter sp.]|uniref:AMP-binding protein n=1 Tax=Polaribacter sp. TaxID=1920175 RepID=UPI003EF0B30F
MLKLNKFHKNFKLNGISFTSVDELLSYVQNVSEDSFIFLQNWFSEDDFIIVNTSGSTGKPKPIRLQKKRIVNSALATGKHFNLKKKTTALLCLPMAYIAGKLMMVRALTLGWHLDVVHPSSYPLRGIVKEYDFSAMVPLQVSNSLDELYKIKKLIIGGGVVSIQLQEKLQLVTTEAFATYGMTETITHIAVKKLNCFFSSTEKQVNKSNNIDSYQEFLSGYYKTLPNVTIYKDQRNCLVIDAQKVSKEIIFTNDVVQLISDTQFKWLGRFDAVINSGGIKLHPEKIEEKLSKIIEQRFFVAGIPDKKLGQKLVLIVELEQLKTSKFKDLFHVEIKKRTSLSKIEIPREIYFIDDFIETETKKIQRSKTLDLLKF